MQAVAEGVASSVLNSPLPSAPVFVAHDGREINTEFEGERRITEGNAESQRSDRKMEVIFARRICTVSLFSFLYYCMLAILTYLYSSG